MPTGPNILGIDIGTTKVAAVIINTNRRVLTCGAKSHCADKPTPAGFSEQSVEVLLDAARDVVLSLPQHLRTTIGAVGVTGQMHGAVVLGESLQPITPLITWQDNRCLADDFLAALQNRTGYPLSSGFGCATLARLVRKGHLPPHARNACTIGDLLAARLAGLDRPVTDPTNAAGWGLFDLRKLDWDYQAVERAGFAANLLPQVVPCGSRIGTVSADVAREFAVPPDIPVSAAIGDNQASLLATLTDPPHELALTLGTGGQLSAVVGPAEVPSHPEAGSTYRLSQNCHPERSEGSGPRMKTTLRFANRKRLSFEIVPYEFRPFVGGQYVVVAASLCGGSAWSWLAQTVERWLGELNLESLPRDTLYKRLNELGLHATCELPVRPHFLGERYDNALRGSVCGIDMTNFTLGALARGLARGIIENLKTMLPEFALTGRTAVVGSGNALRRNPLLQQMAGEVLRLPVRIPNLDEEAACGAAINAASDPPLCNPGDNLP